RRRRGRRLALHVLRPRAHRAFRAGGMDTEPGSNDPPHRVRRFRRDPHPRECHRVRAARHQGARRADLGQPSRRRHRDRPAAPAGAPGTDRGHLPTNRLAPPVQIEQVTADGHVYDAAGGRLRLPARVRDLAIDYTALSLVAPEKVRFKIKLEGQDDDWRELVNERRVQYTNLPPRDYRFLVKAANDSGVWNET